MKVLHLSHSLGRGGAETMLLHLCRYLNQEAAFFVITDIGGALEGDFEKVLGSRLLHWKRKLLLDVFYVRRLRKFISNESIDVVHTHTAGDALYAWMATLGLKIPIVDTHHGFRISSRLISKIVSIWMLPKVAMNVFVSFSQKDVYHQKLRMGFSSQVVYNGIDFSSIAEKRKGELRHQLGVSDNELLMGMVGNFGNAVRNPMVICEALNRLNIENRLSFHFVFIGARNPRAGWFYDRCIEYCAQNGLSQMVHFVGGRSDVHQILADLDLFVYSTCEDTFGIGVVEAQVAGLPVVANNHPVMMEVLDPRTTEFFPSGDSKALAGILAKWKPPTKALLMEVAKASREKFSIGNCFEKYQALYKKVIHE